MVTNCPNCGAPVHDRAVCEYCGTVVKDDLGDKYNTEKNHVHNEVPSQPKKQSYDSQVRQVHKDSPDVVNKAIKHVVNGGMNEIKRTASFWLLAVASFLTFGTPLSIFFAVMGKKKTRRKMFTTIIILDIIVMLIIIALLVYKFFIK